MQNSRLRLVDLNYHCHDAITQPGDVLAIHAPSDRYAYLLSEKMEVHFVKHADLDVLHRDGHITYRFFKSRNRFWHIPFATHRYVKKLQPGIVLVQGLVFPLQLIFLAILLGRKTTIIVQHHGERPCRGLKLLLQRLAGKFIQACFFTSNGNAAAWIDKKIISNAGKCHEVLEASTFFIQEDKTTCRALLEMGDEMVFLWVGRLHTLKDPITVLQSFAGFLNNGGQATLYMIYQSDELLPEIKALLNSNPLLQNAVKLVGKLLHSELAAWYSAADFFLSGSHKEGSGYALIEAMACGCIPVVTDIPSFRKITGKGSACFLFPPGDSATLLHLLNQLEHIDRKAFSIQVLQQFRNQLSFETIAADIYRVCRQLNPE
ncbi:MAG: glycosyltransferase family 4 protein [Ferruginibacter sp.]